MTFLTPEISPSFYNFLNKYFEKISLVYHIIFITFLVYLIEYRKKGTKISYTLIRLLGIYVISYGLIILFIGPRLIK